MNFGDVCVLWIGFMGSLLKIGIMFFRKMFFKYLIINGNWRERGCCVLEFRSCNLLRFQFETVFFFGCKEYRKFFQGFSYLNVLQKYYRYKIKGLVQKSKQVWLRGTWQVLYLQNYLLFIIVLERSIIIFVVRFRKLKFMRVKLFFYK